jgi:alginate O-acetyltransferase complex protein AlgI
VFAAAGRRQRRYVVLAFNAVFLANLLSWAALALYALLTLATYLAGVAISRGTRFRRPLFYASLAVLIGLFFAFRAPFLQAAIDAGLGGSGSLARRIGVVYGYSYFLFKSINFLVSAFVGSIRSFDLLNYLNFIFFFSSFTAGPIARYVDHQDESFAAELSSDTFVEGIHRILNGLIKKYVFVDMIAQFSLTAFDTPYQIRSVLAGWTATLAYLFYIYVDFSAYSDIAIGAGLLFGYRLPENFDYPLLKRNLVLFWESWHMSLTSWIRDHVFTPLNWKALQLRRFRRSGAVPVGSYVVTMSIFALWHSLTLPFLVFGLLHGLALALTQKTIALRRRHLSEGANRFVETNLLARALGAVAVNIFVALSLILFRYDLGDSLALARYLFTGTME